MTDKGEAVIETKIDEEYHVEEEGSERIPGAAADDDGSKEVHGGHVVPKGVAVEELKNYNGHKQLRDQCPVDVQKLMTDKGLFDVYDKFVHTLAAEKNTRGPLGKWRDVRINILQLESARKCVPLTAFFVFFV